jgi:hypothetical protein
VYWLICRKRGDSPSPAHRYSRHAAPKVRRANPYSLQEGEIAIAFRVGSRYYNGAKNRVFECVGVKGKRARLVFWSCLDDVEGSKAMMLDNLKYGQTSGFVKVRVDDGVETCERGALRANRLATEQEIAREREFLRDLRRRERTC